MQRSKTPDLQSQNGRVIGNQREGRARRSFGRRRGSVHAGRVAVRRQGGRGAGRRWGAAPRARHPRSGDAQPAQVGTNPGAAPSGRCCVHGEGGCFAQIFESQTMLS